MIFIRTAILFVITLNLAGCISAYKLPESNTGTSFLKLEKEDGQISFGGVIMMVSIDDEFACRPGKGITDQQKMATLSRGSAAGQFNKEGLFVESKSNFRILVRSVGINSVEIGTWYADADMCDVVLSFPTVKDKTYKILSSTNETGCDVRVVETGSVETEVKTNQYTKC